MRAERGGRNYFQLFYNKYDSEHDAFKFVCLFVFKCTDAPLHVASVLESFTYMHYNRMDTLCWKHINNNDNNSYKDIGNQLLNSIKASEIGKRS